MGYGIRGCSQSRASPYVFPRFRNVSASRQPGRGGDRRHFPRRNARRRRLAAGLEVSDVRKTRKVPYVPSRRRPRRGRTLRRQPSCSPLSLCQDERVAAEACVPVAQSSDGARDGMQLAFGGRRQIRVGRTWDKARNKSAPSPIVDPSAIPAAIATADRSTFSSRYSDVLTTTGCAVRGASRPMHFDLAHDATAIAAVIGKRRQITRRTGGAATMGARRQRRRQRGCDQHKQQSDFHPDVLSQVPR
jgi:hypothetical protein